MHSSRPSIPPRPRRFESGRRTEAKPPSHPTRREDKNIKVSSSPCRPTRAPPEPSRYKSTGQSARSSVAPHKTIRQQKINVNPISRNPKYKLGHAASNLGADVDPNCNETSLPCLCCDDPSTHDSNSLFNHNHNNNNTVTIRQQLKFGPPSQEEKETEKKPDTQDAKCQMKEKQSVASSVANPIEDKNKENGIMEEKEGVDHTNDNPVVKASGKVDENGNGNAHDVVDDVNDDEEDEDDEDEQTLVPSCYDCPASLLDFSLTSSTSSSSTSISSCSDLESDCLDTLSDSFQQQDIPEQAACHSTVFQYCSLPLDQSTSMTSSTPCSPDEGYPSAPPSPSSDFIESKVPDEETGIKVDLLNFLDSVDELGKVDRFYQIVQLAHWEFEDDLDLRYRLVHQEMLERVNKQIKLISLKKCQEAGLDFYDEDFPDAHDEMEPIDKSWKLYKSNKSCDSYEYSDAGVDMIAPSDLDEPSTPDSLVPSPADPPPRPPKPPARHSSAQSEAHTYINIIGNTPSVSSISSPTKSFRLTVSPSSATISSTISKLPALPPPPSQPVPYFTLYTDSPTLSSPTPPIPPPRRRHKARLEAQRLAKLESQKTSQSLPAPTTRPPPLPPPPALPSPPAIPPPPSLPPPPSFHALDVEIRKLLALAGITQAELLRLSPELGVCVDGVLSEEDDSEALNIRDFGVSESKKWKRDSMKKGNNVTWMDEPLKKSMYDKAGFNETEELDTVIKEEASKAEQKEGIKDTFRTTSFGKMSRQYKQNEESSNSSCNCGLIADSYYSTAISNKPFTNSTFGHFDYASVIPDSPPPPPPPRPLPPRPQILSHPPEFPILKPCTLLANATRPDRFDWLIAFTPETETPPIEIKKRSGDATLQKFNSVPKITTFKELRNRGKQASPPTPVPPEPDPTVITPDPDFLYNLKWRREKADGDGSQWEYTSHAQAAFLQPPPTPESLARFRELRYMKMRENASLESNSMQQMSGLASQNNQFNFSDARNREHQRNQMEDTEVRGMADGGQTWEARTRSVRSLSIAGSAAESGVWMGEDVRPPLRGDGLSSLCLQEKRALVSAVSVAVEAILAQFSSSRTLVQKALSGDSSVNPTLGRLVLQCLCPAMHNLLCDGLKPHQSDLITGRRPNSTWGLVQASTKPGPNTQALCNLQAKVAALPQLKQSLHRFNAFLLGLLNIKRLDYWLLHLQTCYDVLDAYYYPTAFMSLSSTFCKPLFDELQLLLQPLSLLTFNLDLLFQHHHFDLLSPELNPTSCNTQLSSRGQPQTNGQHLMSPSTQGLEGSVPKTINHKSSSSCSLSPGVSHTNSQPIGAFGKGETSPQLQWLKEKEVIEPPNIWSENTLSQQAGQALQETWGAMMRWGERVGQNWTGLLSGSSEETREVQTAPNLSLDSGSDGKKTPGQELLSAIGGPVPWGLGRLFGATKSPNNQATMRRPSHWLSPGVTVLSRITSPGHSFLPDKIEIGEMEKDQTEKDKETTDRPKPLRSIRALCDHTGTGTELSFRKGEELLLLGGVDQDWIRCRQGDKEGLVPIGYASLIM